MKNSDLFSEQKPRSSAHQDSDVCEGRSRGSTYSCQKMNSTTWSESSMQPHGTHETRTTHDAREHAQYRAHTLHVARSGASSGSSNALLDAAPEARVHKKNTVTSPCITGTLAPAIGRIAASSYSQGLRRCSILKHEFSTCKTGKEKLRQVARVCGQCGRTKRVATPDFSERAPC